MKACYLILISIMLSAGMVVSCNKNDNDNDPTSTGTLEDLDAVFDYMAQRQKSYVDIAPVELPDYVTASDDTSMQKLVAFAARIDSSREKAIFPALAGFNGSDGSSGPIKSIPADLLSSQRMDDDRWEIACYLEDTPNWFCRFTKWENDGKLNVVFTQQNSLESDIRHIVIQGEHSNGFVYDEPLMIQYWLTMKDSTYSEYAVKTIFFPDPPCGDGILWRFITEVEGEDAWLHFMGESKSLATYIYTHVTYTCNFIEGHHIESILEMKIYPDGMVVFTVSFYSLNLHDVYVFSVYGCMEDGSWVEVIYNEDGSVRERKQWPPESQIHLNTNDRSDKWVLNSKVKFP
ncbi:MAG TPA: hypothetical protein ENO05_09365 [Bacteroides sp.]|nr:hypothetical protein [Bacteroides sp.]